MILELACAAVMQAEIHRKIDWMSAEHGAYPEMVRHIIDGEAKKSQSGAGVLYWPCGDGDQHLDRPDGLPHRSRGIAQINEWYHPEVTDEQAHDPDFAIMFVIDGLRDGKCSEWTTCRAFKKRNPSHPYFAHP